MIYCSNVTPENDIRVFHHLIHKSDVHLLGKFSKKKAINCYLQNKNAKDILDDYYLKLLKREINATMTKSARK